MFKKSLINITFAEALAQMPKYEKFMKDILRNKKKLEDYETVMLNECSIVLLNKQSLKLEKALCDLRASINLTPLSVFRKLRLG